MHFTVEAQKIVADHLKPGDVALDATAGNGHDTLFLAQSVGSKGTVYAIDIQAEAIARLGAKLKEHDLSDRIEMRIANHAELKQLVAPEWHGHVACAMFNLGYLPFGNKSITTSRESTLAAIDAALDLLRPSGIMTILAYVGHPGGRDEADAVGDWMERRARELSGVCIRDETNPDSPILWVVEKR